MKVILALKLERLYIRHPIPDTYNFPDLISTCRNWNSCDEAEGDEQIIR
jgi:hypothetical protein